MGWPPNHCNPERTGATEALDARIRREREARHRRDQAQNQLRNAEQQIERAQRQRRKLLNRAGLPDDEAGWTNLRRLLDHLPDYREREAELQAARIQCDQQRKRIGAPTVADYDGWNAARLDQERHAAAEAAARHQEIISEIGQIQGEISAVREGSTLEEALAEMQAAEEALRVKRRDNARNFLVGLLRDRIAEATEQAYRPDILRRAQDLFARFTNDRYRLDVEPGNPPMFRAFDVVLDRRMTLDQLSDGTRVQLLIAVRLAYVQYEEDQAGIRLPLLIDEAVATSDPARADALIASVVAAAATGRQVFVLTAQPDEAAKWQRTLAGAVDDRSFHLGTWATSPPDIAVLDPDKLAAAGPAAVAAPGKDATLGDYIKALKIPKLSPFDQAGQAHTGLLLVALRGPDDKEGAQTLHRLLKMGFDQAGPLVAFLHHSPDTGKKLLGDKGITALETVFQGLDAALAAARRGRNKPVTYAFLEAAGGVPPTKLEEVWQLTEEVGHDPQRLLDGLREKRVKRFSQEKREELEAELLDAGILQHEAPLDDAGLRHEIRKSMGTALVDGPADANTVARIAALIALKDSTTRAAN